MKSDGGFSGARAGRAWIVGIALSALAASLFVGGASATSRVATGDTCIASGNGTSYTLNVTIPSGAPQQFGFAFGANSRVTNVSIPGTTGTLSTSNLPASTTGAWLTSSPMLPGSAVANVTTTAGVSGSFMVVPASSTTPSYFDPIRCSLEAGKPAPSNAFTVNHTPKYAAASRTWALVVAISGRGTVSATQLRPTIGTGGSKSATVKSLIQARSAGLKSAGKVTLRLRATAAGQAVLNKSGVIKLRMNIAFAPTGGKSASKTISLTLRR